MKKVAALCMIMTVIAFLGFMVENIWLLLTKGYMDNRNMYLPFLIGYGMAIIAIYLMFGTPKEFVFFGRKTNITKKWMKMAVYFLLVMLCVCVGEIVLGKFVEKTCHFYWWDYSELPLNITRYTTIPTSMAFATMIVVFMNYIFNPLYQFFLAWDYRVLCTVAMLMMFCLMGDFLGAAYRMHIGKRIIKKKYANSIAALLRGH